MRRKRRSKDKKTVEPSIWETKDHKRIKSEIQESLDESNMDTGSKNSIISIKITDEENGQRIIIITSDFLSVDAIGTMCMNLSMAFLDGMYNGKDTESEFFRPDVESILSENSELESFLSVLGKKLGKDTQ